MRVQHKDLKYCNMFLTVKWQNSTRSISQQTEFLLFASPLIYFPFPTHRTSNSMEIHHSIHVLQDNLGSLQVTEMPLKKHIQYWLRSYQMINANQLTSVSASKHKTKCNIFTAVLEKRRWSDFQIHGNMIKSFNGERATFQTLLHFNHLRN